MSEAEQQEESWQSLLQELIGYAKYFADEDKQQELATKLTNAWFSDASAPKKAMINSALKLLTPWVLKLASKSGAKLLAVGKNKTHERLSRLKPYRFFIQRMVNTLKTASDKTYDQLLEEPNADTLDALTSDDAKWSNLSNTEKSAVRMLAYLTQQQEQLTALINTLWK